MALATDFPCNRIILFDTTLRDGLNMSGLSLDLGERQMLAFELDRMGIDAIEAGYSLNGKQDLAALTAIAPHLKRAIACGLAAPRADDIDAVAQALAGAAKPRISTYTSTQLSRERELEPLLATVRTSVSRAKSWVTDVQWTAMHALDSELEIVSQALAAAIASGATTVCLADTSGVATPDDIAEVIEQLRARLPELHTVTLGVHCHNRQGWAVENSLAALEAGARQVEVTLEGIGPQEGNTNLEQLAIGIRDASRCAAMELDLDFEMLETSSQAIADKLSRL